jgi:hypothetical protein
MLGSTVPDVSPRMARRCRGRIEVADGVGDAVRGPAGQGAALAAAGFIITTAWLWREHVGVIDLSGFTRGSHAAVAPRRPTMPISIAPWRPRRRCRRCRRRPTWRRPLPSRSSDDRPGRLPSPRAARPVLVAETAALGRRCGRRAAVERPVPRPCPAVWTPPAWRSWEPLCASSGGSGRPASPSYAPLQVPVRGTCVRARRAARRPGWYRNRDGLERPAKLSGDDHERTVGHDARAALERREDRSGGSTLLPASCSSHETGTRSRCPTRMQRRPPPRSRCWRACW